MDAVPKFKGDAKSHDKLVVEHFLIKVDAVVQRQGYNERNGEAVSFLQSKFETEASVWQTSIEKLKTHKKLDSYPYWVQLKQSATSFQTQFRTELQKTDIRKESKQASAFLRALPKRYWDIFDQEF